MTFHRDRSQRNTRSEGKTLEFYFQAGVSRLDMPVRKNPPRYLA